MERMKYTVTVELDSPHGPGETLYWVSEILRAGQANTSGELTIGRIRVRAQQDEDWKGSTRERVVGIYSGDRGTVTERPVPGYAWVQWDDGRLSPVSEDSLMPESEAGGGAFRCPISQPEKTRGTRWAPFDTLNYPTRPRSCTVQRGTAASAIRPTPWTRPRGTG